MTSPRDAPEPRRPSYRRGLSFGVLSFVASGLLSLVSSIATARIFGVHVIGEYALCTAPVGVAWFLSTVQERPGLIRELVFLKPRAPRVAGLFWSVFSFSFTLTVIVGALTLVGTYFVFRGPIGQPELFAPAAVNMAGYVLLTNTCWNIDAILSSFRAGRSLFWVRQNQMLAFLGLAVGLGIADRTVWSLVFAGIASWILSFAHRLVVTRHYIPVRISQSELRDGFRTLPDILRFGLRVTPGGIADGISSVSGTWVLGIVSTVSVVGGFNRAYTIGQRFMELNYRLSEMLFPTLLERRAQGDFHGFDRALVDTIRYCAVGMLWPAAAAGGAALGVMRIFGHGFTNATGALVFSLLLPAACTIAFLQRHAAISLNRPGMSSWSAGLRMLVTLTATIGLAQVIGATGAALAVVLGFLADSLFMYGVTRSYLATPLRVLWPLRQVLAMLASYAGGFATAHVLYASIGGVGGLLIALIAGTIAYAIIFVTVGGLNRRDRERASQLITRLRARRILSRDLAVTAKGADA